MFPQHPGHPGPRNVKERNLSEKLMKSNRSNVKVEANFNYVYRTLLMISFLMYVHF